MKTTGLGTGYTVLLLVFTTLVVYYPTLFAPFNSLDDEVFVNYLLNLDGFSLSRHFFPTGSPEYYRPLLTLSFEIDRYIGGLLEPFMHLVNILIHTTNVILVFFLAREFGHFLGRQGNLVPFLCGALFAIHPLNTEAVNWIAGRTDLLAGLGVFAALLLFLKSLRSNKLFWGAVGMVFFLAGSLCKETALFLAPGLFVILVWHSVGNVTRWPVRRFLAMMITLTLFIYAGLRHLGLRYDRGITQTMYVITDIAVGKGVGDAAAVPTGSAFDAALVLCKTVGFYAVKLVQPLPLNFAIHRVPNVYWVPGLLILAILVYILHARRPAGVLFLVSAGIASSALLAVFSGVAWTPIAERYMYIPSGIFVISALFAVPVPIGRLRWQKVVSLIVPLVLLLFAGASVNRNIVWQDNLTLYQDTAQKSPDFAPVKMELARALYAHDCVDEAEQLTLEIATDAKQISSLNRAATLAYQEKYDEARAYLLVEIEKHNALERHALNMLIKITAEMAEKTVDGSLRRLYFQEMVGWMNRLMEFSKDPFNWYRLGRIHLWLGNREKARFCFSEATRLLPKKSPYLDPSRKLVEELSQ